MLPTVMQSIAHDFVFDTFHSDDRLPIFQNDLAKSSSLYMHKIR